MKRPHLKPVIKLLKKAAFAPPPGPWETKASLAVGGLLAIGFGPGTDLLLVISSSGRSVIDATTGERLARDGNTEAYDAIALEASAIGPLEGQVIRLSGLDGGGLPAGTDDGWQVDRFVLDWPLETLTLTPPGSWVYGILYGHPHDFTKMRETSEIRAWGFSPTGRSLVLATSSDLEIWGRDRE